MTRLEFEELARSHRTLEEKCYQLETILLQLHPELGHGGQPSLLSSTPVSYHQQARQLPQPSLLPLPITVPQTHESAHLQAHYRTPTTTAQPSASGTGPSSGGYGPSSILTPHSAPPMMSAPSPLRPMQPISQPPLLSQPHGPGARPGDGYSSDSRKRLREEGEYDAESERERGRVELPAMKERRQLSPGVTFEYEYMQTESAPQPFPAEAEMHRERRSSSKPLRLRPYDPSRGQGQSHRSDFAALSHTPPPPRVQVSPHPQYEPMSASVAPGGEPGSGSGSGSTEYHRGVSHLASLQNRETRIQRRVRGRRRASSTSPSALARIRQGQDEASRAESGSSGRREEQTLGSTTSAGGLSGPGTGLGLVTPVSAKDRERGREYAMTSKREHFSGRERERQYPYEGREVEVKHESGTEGSGERRRTCLSSSSSPTTGSYIYSFSCASDEKAHIPRAFHPTIGHLAREEILESDIEARQRQGVPISL